MFNLKGKKALITGSSRGIGRACALELAKRGADIIAHYASDRERAEEVKRAVIAEGGDCLLTQANLSEANSAEALCSRIADAKWDVDILVLNASVQRRQNWLEVKEEDFHDQINCNLQSSLALLQRLIPQMRQKQWGRVVTIGSVHEVKPNPDMLVYAASKAGLRVIAKSLAVKLAPDGITVNSVAPGVILTERNSQALENDDWNARVRARIPSGTIGEPRDCAEIVAFLCSESGRYINGQNIFVDGAMSAT